MDVPSVDLKEEISLIEQPLEHIIETPVEPVNPTKTDIPLQPPVQPVISMEDSIIVTCKEPEPELEPEVESSLNPDLSKEFVPVTETEINPAKIPEETIGNQVSHPLEEKLEPEPEPKIEVNRDLELCDQDTSGESDLECPQPNLVLPEEEDPEVEPALSVENSGESQDDQDLTILSHPGDNLLPTLPLSTLDDSHSSKRVPRKRKRERFGHNRESPRVSNNDNLTAVEIPPREDNLDVNACSPREIENPSNPKPEVQHVGFFHGVVQFVLFTMVGFVVRLHHTALNALVLRYHVAFTILYIYAFPFIVSPLNAATNSAPSIIFYAFLIWFFLNKGMVPVGSGSPPAVNFRLLFPLFFVFEAGM